MIFLTHISFALFLGLIIIKYVDLRANIIIFIIITLFSSLIPDLDESKSFLGKYVKPIGWLFKHRGLFHSIFLMIILMIIVFLITQNRTYAYAVMIGFGSHLILDSMTVSGTTLFWPSKLRIKGKIRTCGLIDWGLCVVFIVISVFIVL